MFITEEKSKAISAKKELRTFPAYDWQATIWSLFYFDLNSEAPETTKAQGARRARSGTNGQAVVRALKNFHDRFRRCLKPQIDIDLRQKLFFTLKKIGNKI